MVERKCRIMSKIFPLCLSWRAVARKFNDYGLGCLCGSQAVTGSSQWTAQPSPALKMAAGKIRHGSGSHVSVFNVYGFSYSTGNRRSGLLQRGREPRDTARGGDIERIKMCYIYLLSPHYEYIQYILQTCSHKNKCLHQEQNKKHKLNTQTVFNTVMNVPELKRNLCLLKGW